MSEMSTLATLLAGSAALSVAALIVCAMARLMVRAFGLAWR